MTFEITLDEHEKLLRREDQEALEDEERKLGEGGYGSAHLSTRNEVVKDKSYDPDVYDPVEAWRTVKDLEVFPRMEIDGIQEGELFNHFTVRMEKADFMQPGAVEIMGLEEVVRRDVQMLQDLEEQGIFYRDFKPENIGYFQEEELVPKPVDVFDYLAWVDGGFDADGLDDAIHGYIHGTPETDGITDLYGITTPEAEQLVIDAFDSDYHELLEETGLF